ncbi:PP2C family protein-serine/threonine phosphatase [Pseudarthrobacter sp. NPDC092419]|uniref:PP2C family protein-serine/threonine phosphatase n=1 Tax=Pseudarthrobacter sp. NPDC092419 TaxID=3364414 RepID=UPI0037F7A047
MNAQPNQAAGTTAGTRLALTCGHGTDRGHRRALNEDSYLAREPVFSVADGMGGHEAGEVASGLCVQALAAIPQVETGERSLTAPALQAHLLRADAAIRGATGSRAGTTLSGAVLVEQLGRTYWLVMNVGDSRTYRFSHGHLEQLSVDHSLVQELVDDGEISAEEAASHPQRHVVTRALGTGEDNEADFWLVPAEAGDRVLVCSDGLTGELADRSIARILDTVADPQDAAMELIHAALDHGGRDNVTVIVVDTRAAGAA